MVSAKVRGWAVLCVVGLLPSVGLVVGQDSSPQSPNPSQADPPKSDTPQLKPGDSRPADAKPGTPGPDAAAASDGQNAPPRQVLKPDPAPLQFESRGLDYSALTRNGVTVMFAQLPSRIRDFNVIQATITNGGLLTWTVKPMDFVFTRQDGTTLRAVSADEVVESLLEKASRNDVIHLQLMYEDSIYALANYRPTNGYEKRREAAMAQFVNPRFKAAAAASAVSMGVVKLRPGESTDGAVFFENRTKEKNLGPGQLEAHICGEQFDFQILPEPKLPK